MADLIDRETVRLAYEKSFENDNHRIEGASAIHMQEHRHMLHILDKIPAVDAVEVVRCKECRFCKKYPTSDGGKMCTNQEWNTVYYPPVEDDDYCSRGERREDDG